MKKRTAERLVLLAAVVVSAALLASESVAAPLYAAPVIVQSDGEVVATLAKRRGFVNELYLESPANALGLLFTNKMTPFDTTVSLGNFTAGTELIFRMHVADTGNDFYTGPASRNADLIPHAFVDDEFVPDASYVAFEDNFDGGDLNYYDLNFSLTNTRAGEVPEPATCLLGGSCLVLLGASRRRRAR